MADVEDPWGQSRATVRFDWGPAGAARTASPGGFLVVVDVLSFTTAIGIAVERGTAVVPCPWDDGRARALASRERAELAVGRREVSAAHPWSLSPAALRAARVTPRLVLPSPNGSTIAAAVSGVTVVAVSLRREPRRRGAGLRVRARAGAGRLRR